jgi:hypothetical protein
MKYQLLALQTQFCKFHCVFDTNVSIETMQWQFRQEVDRYCQRKAILAFDIISSMEENLDIFIVHEGPVLFRGRQKSQL